MMTPMTDQEWSEFCSMTMHGPPPWKTLRRVYATVGRLMDERDEAIRAIGEEGRLRGLAEAEVERLRGALERISNMHTEWNRPGAPNYSLHDARCEASRALRGEEG